MGNYFLAGSADWMRPYEILGLVAVSVLRCLPIALAVQSRR